MTVYAVDFGTERTRTAVIGPSTATPKIDELTSCISLSGGAIKAGDAVLLTAGAGRTVAVGLKRILGRAPDDEVVARWSSQHGLAVTNGPEGLAIAVEDGSDVGVRAGVSAVLRQALSVSTKSKARGVEAVLAVPSWIDDAPLRTLRRAADDAGFDILATVDVCAASAAWLACNGEHGGTVAIVDFGAGGVSAAITRSEYHADGDSAGVMVEVLAASGSTRLCGDDIDAEVMRRTLTEVPAAERERARQACKMLKHELSKETEARRAVKLSTGTQNIVMLRSELELILEPALDQIGPWLTELARTSGIEAADLDAVYLTGGLAVLPGVQRTVEKALTRVPALLDANTAVRGAALVAASLAGFGHVTTLRDPRHASAPIQSSSSDATVEEQAAEHNDATDPNTARSGNVVVRRRQTSTERNRPAVTRRKVDPRSKPNKRGGGVTRVTAPRRRSRPGAAGSASSSPASSSASGDQAATKANTAAASAQAAPPPAAAKPAAAPLRAPPPGALPPDIGHPYDPDESGPHPIMSAARA